VEKRCIHGLLQAKGQRCRRTLPLWHKAEGGARKRDDAGTKVCGSEGGPVVCQTPAKTVAGGWNVW